MKLFNQKWIFGLVLFALLSELSISSTYAGTYSFSACSPTCYTHVFTLDTNKSTYNQNESMVTSAVYDGSTCYSSSGCYIGPVFYLDVRNNFNSQTQSILPKISGFQSPGELKTSIFNVGNTPVVSSVTFIINLWYGNFGVNVTEELPKMLSWDSSLPPPTPGYTIGWFFSNLATIPYTVNAPPTPTVNLNFSFIEMLTKVFLQM